MLKRKLKLSISRNFHDRIIPPLNGFFRSHVEGVKVHMLQLLVCHIASFAKLECSDERRALINPSNLWPNELLKLTNLEMVISD